MSQGFISQRRGGIIRRTALFSVVLTLSSLSPGFGDGLCELSGVLMRAPYTYRSYELQLDGGTGRFLLQEDGLGAIPEGTRIWVRGEIKTWLYETETDNDSRVPQGRPTG